MNTNATVQIDPIWARFKGRSEFQEREKARALQEWFENDKDKWKSLKNQAFEIYNSNQSVQHN